MKSNEVSGEEDEQSDFDSEADDGEDGEMEESDRVSTAGDEASVAEEWLVVGNVPPAAKLLDVMPPATYHTNWESWTSYFATYCASTMPVLPVRATMSRAERNRRLAKTKKGADDSMLVPEVLDPYSRVYICTHGWKSCKSPGSGSRPRRNIRLTNCHLCFTVQWNLFRMKLQAKNGIFKHNHKVSPSAFATYPSSRDVVDPLVDARVE